MITSNHGRILPLEKRTYLRGKIHKFFTARRVAYQCTVRVRKTTFFIPTRQKKTLVLFVNSKTHKKCSRTEKTSAGRRSGQCVLVHVFTCVIESSECATLWSVVPNRHRQRGDEQLIVQPEVRRNAMKREVRFLIASLSWDGQWMQFCWPSKM